jgi:hypothetical protein
MPPSGPVYPALHLQSVMTVLASGESEFDGQLEGSGGGGGGDGGGGGEGGGGGGVGGDSSQSLAALGVNACAVGEKDLPMHAATCGQVGVCIGSPLKDNRRPSLTTASKNERSHSECNRVDGKCSRTHTSLHYLCCSNVCASHIQVVVWWRRPCMHGWRRRRRARRVI